jgi:hypothetical protein
MSIFKQTSHAGLALLLAGGFTAQTGHAQSKLASVKAVRCQFQLYAIGNWAKDGVPQGEIKKLASPINLMFDSINVEDGTAAAAGVLVGSATSTPIIVQQSGSYLHFVQILRDGPLYTTTIFDKESTPGKLRAMHTRHAYADFDMPGFTSKPEQYYGECELNPAGK